MSQSLLPAPIDVANGPASRCAERAHDDGRGGDGVAGGEVAERVGAGLSAVRPRAGPARARSWRPAASITWNPPWTRPTRGWRVEHLESSCERAWQVGVVRVEPRDEPRRERSRRSCCGWRRSPAGACGGGRAAAGHGWQPALAGCRRPRRRRVRAPPCPRRPGRGRCARPRRRNRPWLRVGIHTLTRGHGGGLAEDLVGHDLAVAGVAPDQEVDHQRDLRCVDLLVAVEPAHVWEHLGTHRRRPAQASSRSRRSRRSRRASAAGRSGRTRARPAPRCAHRRGTRSRRPGRSCLASSRIRLQL